MSLLSSALRPVVAIKRCTAHAQPLKRLTEGKNKLIDLNGWWHVSGGKKWAERGENKKVLLDDHKENWPGINPIKYPI